MLRRLYKSLPLRSPRCPADQPVPKMAKGHRGKPQTAEANNGPAKAKTNNKAADKENSTDTQNLQMSKGRNRRGDKPKLIVRTS